MHGAPPPPPATAASALAPHGVWRFHHVASAWKSGYGPSSASGRRRRARRRPKPGAIVPFSAFPPRSRSGPDSPGCIPDTRNGELALPFQFVFVVRKSCFVGRRDGPPSGKGAPPTVFVSPPPPPGLPGQEIPTTCSRPWAGPGARRQEPARERRMGDFRGLAFRRARSRVKSRSHRMVGLGTGTPALPARFVWW